MDEQKAKDESQKREEFLRANATGEFTDPRFTKILDRLDALERKVYDLPEDVSIDLGGTTAGSGPFLPMETEGGTT